MIKKVIDWKIKFYIYIDLIIKETSIERSISFSSSVIFLFEIKFQRIISLVISLIIDIHHEKEKKGYYLKSIAEIFNLWSKFQTNRSLVRDSTGFYELLPFQRHHSSLAWVGPLIGTKEERNWRESRRQTVQSGCIDSSTYPQCRLITSPRFR